ncbi:class I SAM-dependent methyltransferase [Rhodococcus maanshanensis]|uniref:HemK2/MTQ2 family protein methyltransferase n=1 Tax=Rhodococcus maanshanensis TaxID=183556 RepID=UPI0022B394F9|nr:HemK2/MTQ2 family protein methyltransferase [Rhodococcus maanshanensis]MCZ4558828.1 class I SAM-dependent methyltransferase [Rhodococcus maanshanensis]
MLFRLPGVYTPQRDTWLLAEVLACEDVRPGTRVLDLCAGTGALSLRAAAAGAAQVTAVDLSRRAVASTWINARRNGHSIRIMRGDLTEPVRDEHFDLVVSNPPYVPACADALPVRGIARCWDAGKDGRALLDRICLQAPEVLDTGGTLLLMQSAMSGVEKTRIMLEEQGLRVDVAARVEIPFGPVLSSRRGLLEARGLIRIGQHTEEIAVLRAAK